MILLVSPIISYYVIYLTHDHVRYASYDLFLSKSGHMFVNGCACCCSIVS